MRTLSRRELTAALAARQMLLERLPVGPAEAVSRLTPLQGQDPPAPYVALTARLEGFAAAELEAAIAAGAVVKTTIMRSTLHLAAGADYPAYAQLVRQTRMRAWRRTYAHLDEATFTADLAAWFEAPRTNDEIRARLAPYGGEGDDQWRAVFFARTLLPLVQVPPAGFRSDRSRPRFVVDPRPLPSPEEAARLVLTRYLAAFGPASRRDAAAWAGVAQRDFGQAWAAVAPVSYRDERGVELLDLPGQALPPVDTRLPVRFLARWDQALLAHADRERIIPAQLQPLRLTLSGDATVTVNGRVAASWRLLRSGGGARLEVTRHVEIGPSARREIRSEGERTARLLRPQAGRIEVVGV